MALLAVVHAGAAQAVVFDPAFAVDEKAHFEFPLLAHSGHGFLLWICCVSVPFSQFFCPVTHLGSEGKVVLPLRVDGPAELGISSENAPFFFLLVCSDVRVFHTPAAVTACRRIPCIALATQSNPGTAAGVTH